MQLRAIQVDILTNNLADVSQKWWFFPLKNPALVSMSLSFLAGILVSLVTRDRAAEEGFVELERRSILGPLAGMAQKPAVAE